MKRIYYYIIILAIAIQIAFPLMEAQIEEDPSEIEEWHIQLDEVILFIGQDYWVNVSGVGNTSFTLEIKNLDNTNLSYTSNHVTNDDGATYIDTPESFGLDDEAFYQIILYVNGTIKRIEIIEVVYDEIQSLVLEIEDLKRLVRNLYIEDKLGDEKDLEQDRLYKKWLIVILLIIFPLSLGHLLINAYWHYYEIQERRAVFWEEINTNKPLGGLGMDLSRDHRMLYPGSSPEAPVFTADMPGVTDDMVGLTKEQYWQNVKYLQKRERDRLKNERKSKDKNKDIEPEIKPDIEEEIDLLDLIDSEMLEKNRLKNVQKDQNKQNAIKKKELKQYEKQKKKSDKDKKKELKQYEKQKKKSDKDKKKEE